MRIPRIRIRSEPAKKSFAARPIARKFKKGYIAYKKKKQMEKTAGSQFFYQPMIYAPYSRKEIGQRGPKEAQALAAQAERGGVEIPLRYTGTGGAISIEDEREMLQQISITYHLIPRFPKKGDLVFAYANIKWDPSAGELVYSVFEPRLMQQDTDIIEFVKKELEEKLDVDFIKLGEVRAKSVLRAEIIKILDAMPTPLDENKKLSLMYYIEKDIMGLGKIEPMINDPNIEDISCDGVGIPIYVYHRDPQIGSLKTNIIFNDIEELNNFVFRLAQKCKKMISIAEPLLDGALPDGSRVQATLGTDIARKGSNFTIRKFTEEPLTPSHMLRKGTLNSTQLAYLWLAIDNGQSVLISGGTATGKTSLLNALSLFIRPSLKIVSIEDTAELRLPHPHWIPEVARTALSTEGGKKGEVSLFDLLKSSLRQRPDYIIMGEVRGKEAFVLFQQMASIPGNEQVLVYNESHIKHIPISELGGKTYNVPAMDPDTGRISVVPMKMLVEHAPVYDLYKIKTRTGREIIATGNHSIFSYNGKIEPAVVSEMKEGDTVLIPARLPSGLADTDHLSLLELFPDIRVYSPRYVRMAMEKLGFEKASKIAGRTAISNYYGVDNCALPAGKFSLLMKEAGIIYSPEQLQVRFERGKSPKSSARLDITPELLRLIGYYISEGSANTAHKNNSISLYSKDPEVLGDMKRCIKAVTEAPIRERKTRGFGSCTELTFNNKTIFELLRRYCGVGSENKNIPDFVMGLSAEKMGWLLSGLYAGDSSMNRSRFCYYTVSKSLAQGVCNVLLSLSIVPHIRTRKRPGRRTTDYEIVFYTHEERKRFLEHAKPAGKHPVIGGQGRIRMRKVGDLCIDRIKRIERITLESPKPVYDISVPGMQNFVGGLGGVILHNTGHPSIATIHAASIEQLIDRLTTPPISLPPSLLENINVVVFLTLSRLKESYVRRADAILEVIGIKDNKPVTNNVFEWKPISDTFEISQKSFVLKSLAKRMGITEDAIKNELIRRKSILEWMLEQEIYDYREVAKIVSEYYSDPDRVMDMVEAA
jgi:flagellar protein FlaI